MSSINFNSKVPTSSQLASSTAIEAENKKAEEVADEKTVGAIRVAQKILEQEKKFLPDPSCYAITVKQYVLFRLSDIFLPRIDSLTLSQIGHFLCIESLIADLENNDPAINSGNQLTLIKELIKQIPEIKDDLLRLHLLAKQTSILNAPLKGILPHNLTAEELKKEYFSTSSLKFTLEKLIILSIKVDSSIHRMLENLNKQNNVTPDETKILRVTRSMRRKNIVLIQESAIGEKRAQGKKILIALYQKNKKNIFEYLQKIYKLAKFGTSQQISHNLEHLCTQMCSFESLIVRHFDMMIQDYEGTSIINSLKYLRINISNLLQINQFNLIWLSIANNHANKKTQNNSSNYIFTIDEDLDFEPSAQEQLTIAASKEKKRKPKKSEVEHKERSAAITEIECKTEAEEKVASEQPQQPATHLENQEKAFEVDLKAISAFFQKQESAPKLSSQLIIFSHFAKCIESRLEKVHHKQALSSQLSPFHLKDLKLHQQEMRDHLFLTACGMELFTQAILESDFQSLHAILTDLILDFHVVIEQGDKATLVLQTEERYALHHLVGLSQYLGEWDSIGTSQQQFRKDLDSGIIWTRYQKASLKYHENDGSNTPQILQLLQDIYVFVTKIQKNKIKKLDILSSNMLQGIVHTLFGLYSQHCNDILQRIGQEAPLKNENIATYLASMEQLEAHLVDHLKNAVGNDLEQTKNKITHFKHVVDQLEKIAATIQVFTRQLSTSNKELDSDPVTHLKEAARHIRRIQHAIIISEKCTTPHLTAWHYRNVLTPQWLFEQLYMSLVILEKVGYLKNEHDFRKYQELLLMDEKPSKFDLDILEFNLDKGIHYPRQAKVNGHITKLIKIMENSKRFVANPTGFVPPGMDEESTVKHLAFSSTLLEVISRATNLCDLLVQKVIKTQQDR